MSLLTTLIDARQTVYQARFAETQMLNAVGTQQALSAFEQFADAAGVGALYVQGYALGLLQGVVRSEALVRALNDGFYIVILVGLCRRGDHYHHVDQTAVLVCRDIAMTR